MGDSPKVPYISLIKVNGKPILPPLITPEQRKELVAYKQEAIRLEQRLKNCRELQKNLKELLEGQTSTPRVSSQLTFGDDSHIEALNITEKRRNRSLKNIHLSKDLIEVTQYNDNGLKAIEINDLIRTNSNHEDVKRSRSSSEPRSDKRTADINNITPPPAPRVIRSNSYTLETPSPSLLEHLKKNAEQAPPDVSLSDDALESSDFSSVNTVFHKDMNPVPDKNITEIKSPTIEVYQTDISVQQITVNTNNPASGEATNNKQEAFFLRNPFDSLEPDSELLKVLKDIPDVYSQQILDLLKKQHLEQKERLERYDNLNDHKETLETYRSESSFLNGERVHQQDNLIDLADFSPNSSRPNTTETDKLRRSSTFSMSPSQSLYYSVTSDSDTLAATPVHCNELGVLREKNGYYEGVLEVQHMYNCSKELFPVLDPVTIKAIRQEKAASIIGAHVKGYLTRRLWRTDKVQAIIATVKDVLMCALELHQAETIDEKDVELHRRLINQLSAALYSFHEIFFDLSIPEQMAIISTDRQRKLEKLKRPQSGRRSAGRTKSLNSNNRSSNSSRSSSKTTLLNESLSLTKV